MSTWEKLNRRDSIVQGGRSLLVKTGHRDRGQLRHRNLAVSHAEKWLSTVNKMTKVFRGGDILLIHIKEGLLYHAIARHLQ